MKSIVVLAFQLSPLSQASGLKWEEATTRPTQGSELNNPELVKALSEAGGRVEFTDKAWANFKILNLHSDNFVCLNNSPPTFAKPAPKNEQDFDPTSMKEEELHKCLQTLRRSCAKATKELRKSWLEKSEEAIQNLSRYEQYLEREFKICKRLTEVLDHIKEDDEGELVESFFDADDQFDVYRLAIGCLV